MGLSCRICKNKFSVPLTLDEEPSQDFNITTTKCGHLFHQKCLEASLTHQKLSHAMYGSGPFKKMCPAFQCGTLVELESDIIKLCVTPEELRQDWEAPDENESVDSRLTKQLQRLSIERDQLKAKVDKMQFENENVHYTMDETKNLCDDMRSFLHEAEMIQKGDRVFWLNPDGSFSPAKIIELRQKSARSMPYAVINLERKKKSGGPGKTLLNERESFVVPANEILTFKSFFKEYFDEFSYKLRMIISEMTGPQPDTSGKLYRKVSKGHSSAGEISTSSPSTFSISHEAIDQLIVEHLNDSSSVSPVQSQVNLKRRSYGISRRKTFHSGIEPGKPVNLVRSSVKVRSVSQSHSYPQTLTFSDVSAPSPDSSTYSSVFQSPISEIPKDHHEYVSVGERVIWYDTYCDHPQVGNVAALLQYTKCAIVKFDKLPRAPKQFEYRTVPVQQLFPYDLSSPEEKFRIAVIYEFSLEDDTIDEMEENDAPDGNGYQYKLDYNDNHEIIPNFDIPSSIEPLSSIDTNSEPELEEKTPYDSITSTLFSLFYSTNTFERNLLDIDLSDDEKQRSVKQLLTVDVIPNAKMTGNLEENLVQDLLNILEFGKEDYVQPQEFLINIFGEALKSKPFITFANGKTQNVLHLAIPEYHEESIMFAGENNQQQISYLDELFFMTLQTSEDLLASVPSPALILNVNRPHFSHGNFIVPPVKLSLDSVLNANKDEENLCACNKIATWRCRTCVDTLKDKVQGYCDDCRHIAAEFHKDADHFPLLSCSKDGTHRKLKLHSVICKSKSNAYSSFIKCGMEHSDSWVLCQPSSREKTSKIVPVGSIQCWLELLESESQDEIIPEEIPPYVLKLLKEGSVFIYCPLSN